MSLLAQASRAAAPAEPEALIAELRAAKVESRVAAGNALVALGGDAVPALVAGMKNYRQRAVMLSLLQRIGDKASEPLFALLDDAALGSDAAAALALVAGPESAGRVPRLLACAREARTAHSCGTALVRVAPKAGRHADVLAAALTDESSSVRAFAAAALGQLKPGSAVASLTKALSDREPAVRAAAASALGRYGRKARTAVASIKSLEQDPDAEVRVAAAEALRNIDG